MSLCPSMYNNKQGINSANLASIMNIGNQLYSSLSLLTRQSVLMQTELPTFLNVFETDYELQYSESYTASKQSKETYGQTRRLTRELINSSQKQFTCFYKMFWCFQHFSWSNIVKLIMVLFNFKGMVYYSFIGFGRVFTTEFTSAVILLTTLPWIDNCPPLRSSHNIICMNGIHRDFNISCKSVKFRHSGFTRKFILLALN